jgi:alpha-L-fucosidase
MHGQVEELVTNYGKIDLLWFDYSYDDLRGEAWKATELVQMVRKHQPNVLIDNRLETSGEGFGSIIQAEPNYYCGDFASPEQIIPPEGIRNELGKPVPWELCVTINNNWGYNPTDSLYKSSTLLIHKLVECVSKGGNMILNVGPDANGNIDARSQEVLEGIADWMKRNGKSIYSCGNAEIPKPEWGWYTRSGNHLYAHVLEAPVGPLALTGVNENDICYVRRLSDGSEVQRGDSWITKAYEGIPFVAWEIFRILVIHFQMR